MWCFNNLVRALLALSLNGNDNQHLVGRSLTFKLAVQRLKIAGVIPALRENSPPSAVSK
jgi:hypothetical protein